MNTKQALQEARSLIEAGQGDVTYALAVSTDEDTWAPAFEAVYKAAGSPMHGSGLFDRVNVLIDLSDATTPEDWMRLYEEAIEGVNNGT